MNSLSRQSQSSGDHPLRPTKKRLATEQIRLLETCFNANQRLTAELKDELAHRLGLPPRQVAIWYQNRRAREKAEAIEHDYSKIQLDLGNVIAENTRLQQEAGMLRYELNKARQLLLLASTSSASALPSVTPPCDDHPTSNSPGDIICNSEIPMCFFQETCTQSWSQLNSDP